MELTRVRPGDVLGKKYRVEKLLGRGGMGVVVSATHLDLDQRVAVKLMLPSLFADPDSRARFQREARSAVKLRSEHVARVLDTGTFDDGAPYIVMEFLEGNDLAAELERVGTLPVEAVAEYVLQACDAIAEAHVLGIVHRDLKPANIFLTRRQDGSPLVKVLDFGISKASAFDTAALAMTSTSSMLGSPLYMSPEQMRSSRDVDARSDVWSLGIVLYELLTGHVPFTAETLGDLLARVLMDPHTPLTTVRPDVPIGISNLVDRCLAKDRAQRAASVAEVARALAPYVPPRAAPLVERIANVIGAAKEPPVVPAIATSTLGLGPPPAVPSAPAGPVLAPDLLAPVLPGIAATSRAWSGTESGRTPSRTGVVAWIAVGVVLVVGLAAGGLALKQRQPSAPAPSASVELPTSETAAPTAPQSAASPSPSATAPEPAPTSTAATSPPGESASTSSPKAPLVPGAATGRKATPKAPPAPSTNVPVASPGRGTGTLAVPSASASVKKPGILDTSK